MDQALADKFIGVRKMMEQATTEGEAQAAAAAFQRLLVKNAVSEEEAMALGEREKKPFVRIRIKVAEPRTPGISWKNTLIHILLENNFCRSYNPASGGWHEVFAIGKQENLDAVGKLFQVMVPAFEKMCKEAFESKLRRWHQGGRFLEPKGRPHKTSFTISFMLGACYGVEERLRSEMKTMELESGEIRALVPLNKIELDKAESSLMGKVGSGGAGYSASDTSGFNAGYAAGKSFVPHTQLGSGS